MLSAGWRESFRHQRRLVPGLRRNAFGWIQGKTQFIWLGTHGPLYKIDLTRWQRRFPGDSLSLQMGIGVTLDQQWPIEGLWRTHVEHASIHLRQICRISRSLTTQAARAIIHVFICSRVNYGNAFCAGPTSSCTNQLNLNTTALMIGDIPRFGQFIWEELHSLPMHQLFSLFQYIPSPVTDFSALQHIAILISYQPELPRSSIEVLLWSAHQPWTKLPNNLRHERFRLSLSFFRKRLDHFFFDHGLTVLFREPSLLKWSDINFHLLLPFD